MSKQRKGAESNLVCMAEIVGVHGVKGVLKLKVFSENDLMDYTPLCDADGNARFDILYAEPHQNIFLAEIKGISDRTAAEKLRGQKLYVPREKLPEIDEEDTYYQADLIGLAAVSPEGETIGEIVTIANYGAGDLLEIKPPKGASYYLPFTRAIVPHIDFEKRIATIVAPEWTT